MLGLKMKSSNFLLIGEVISYLRTPVCKQNSAIRSANPDRIKNVLMNLSRNTSEL